MGEKPIQHIGVLTGGGDCPGLNAVIRAVVKCAIYEHGWQVTGIEDGFEGLILPGKTRPLGLSDVRGILPRGGTILGTTNRSNPFAYRIRREDGRVVSRDVSGEVMQRIADLGLDGLVVIGGDGSLRIALEFLQMGAPMVGVPKTIDNDVALTDVTFGFDTALDTATEAIDKLHTTAESHHRIMIVEVMGREAGWLALDAGLAGGADVILIPEIPFRLDAVLAKIAAREREGALFSIVVISEGARPLGGERMYQDSRDPLAPKRLGGIGNWLGDEIACLTEREVRTTVLGHVQRGGSPSAFDRKLATWLGSEAAGLVAKRAWGQMVALHGDRIEAVPIADAVREIKTVPLDGHRVRTALAMGLCLGE
ncbi:MAG: 6-phosphofructokinase [Anaerolineae bacterium]